MTSPVPYSEPKRRTFKYDELAFVTSKGSYVYAPATGHMDVIDGDVVIFDGHLRHILKNVRLGRNRAPYPGARIGHATGRRVYYSVEYKEKGIWKRGNPMPTILRSDSQRRPRNLMPQAHKFTPTSPAGLMGPGNERCAVWHTSESDPGSIEIVADWVQDQGSQYHIIWDGYEKNPRKRFIQIFSPHEGARALENADNDQYGTNRHGKVRIQICVIGRAKKKPLVKSPMYGRRDLMEWLDDWNIPRKFNLDNGRSKHEWEKSGHTTHRSCPGNDHVDPGKINTKKLLGP